MHRCLPLIFLAGFTTVAMGQQPLQTVQQVDLQRYSGQWYEVARMPNHWEAQCASDVTVDYTLKPNGSIVFRNDCVRKDGITTTSKSRAHVVDKATDAKLKVVFFWPLAADYWIMALDPNYRWAVVGQPDREYLWVLSRTPSLPPSVMTKIRHVIDAGGYQSSRLILTSQDGRNELARGSNGR